MTGETPKFRPLPPQANQSWVTVRWVGSVFIKSGLPGSKLTVLRLIESGDLIAQRLKNRPGSRWMVDYDSVVAFMAKRRSAE
jgi:hypothetical protein